MRASTNVTARVPRLSARRPKAQKVCRCVTSFLYVKPLAAKGPRRGTSGYMYAKPSSKGVNILLEIEWGQSCALGDLTPATEGHERTRRRSASPPHGQEAPNDRLRMSLNRHLIFARLLHSRSAGTIRQPKAAGAHTTPRAIMPTTSAAHSVPTPPHRDENSTAPLDAPRTRRGAAQADRSAAPRVRPVVASAHCAALNFKRETASPHHVEISAPAHRARKAP